jgi:hypothetical protein
MLHCGIDVTLQLTALALIESRVILRFDSICPDFVNLCELFKTYVKYLLAGRDSRRPAAFLGTQ